MDITEAENIVLNLHAGLEPKDLSRSEVKKLRDKYGEDWFEELGYDEDWEKPDYNFEE